MTDRKKPPAKPAPSRLQPREPHDDDLPDPPAAAPPKPAKPAKPPRAVKTKRPPADEDDVEGDPAEALDDADTTADDVPPAPPPDKRVAPAMSPLKAAGIALATRPNAGLAAQRAAFSDDRKLTKKVRAQLEADWYGSRRTGQIDKFVDARVAAARKRVGATRVMTGDETKNLIVVIPTPSLAVEFLFRMNGWPLGLVFQIVGPPGSGKSGLLAEIIRWFDMAGGVGTLLENETKFSPEWYESILSPEAFRRLVFFRNESVEDWQENLTAGIENDKSFLLGDAKKPGPGRSVPVVYGVDSVMGKLTRESQEKIAEAGAAGRGYPVEAMGITRYLKTVPQMLDGWPMSLVLVNHLKMGKDDDGREKRNKAGGEQISFQETFELQLDVVKSKIQTAQFDGFQVALSCHKNSLGDRLRAVQTRVLWWEVEDPATGQWRQETVWDWDWSTVKLLTDVKGRLGDNLKDMGFHLAAPKVSDVENCAWSKTLGISKENPLPWNDVGRMIREDAGLMNKLRHALRIVTRPVLSGDYLDQQAAAAREVP